MQESQTTQANTTNGKFFKPYAKVLVIPKVASVVCSQFHKRQDLEKVIFPNTVEIVDQTAFAECLNLKEVVFSEGVKKILSGAFSGCENLENVNLPDSVEVVDSQAFYGCSKLRDFQTPKNLTKIGRQAFMWCSGIGGVIFKDTLQSIGNESFSECTNLKYAIFENSLKQVGSEAFSGCENLKIVHLGNGVKQIGPSAFAKCFGLENITLPTALEKIECNTFDRCKNLKQISIPKNVQTIESQAFRSCENLENVIFEGEIKTISHGAFLNCPKLTKIVIPNSVEKLFENSFPAQMNFLYLNKNTQDFLLTTTKDENLSKTHYEILIENGNLGPFSSKNYRTNFVIINNMKEQGLLKFFPSKSTLQAFPFGQIQNFFTNKNYRRWDALAICANLKNPHTSLETQAFSGLLKIFYALGGFSENQGQSEKAFHYTLQHIIVPSQNQSFGELHHFLAEKFEPINPTGPYNPNFSKFFMKYYHQNPDFLTFNFNGENRLPVGKFDYLPWVENSFGAIEKNFANKTINGTGKHEILTPNFVAKHSRSVAYDNITNGNEPFASLVGSFGYSQENFEKMQKVLEKGKQCKQLLRLNEETSNDICFKLLKKNDTLGFVLGDITNCCMRFGDLAESCIVDAYENETSGLIVFEKAKNKDEPSFKNILAQAFVWYDANTKTICLDNIEIPRTVKLELEKNLDNSFDDLFKCVKKCAKNLMRETEKNGIEVNRVTVGSKHNDLRPLLEKYCKLEYKPKAKASNGVFSDAEESQFVLAEKSFEFGKIKTLNN